MTKNRKKSLQFQ